LMALDAGDVLEQWVAVGPAGIVASGIYRNKETSLVLDDEVLAEYVGKRARKGKTLSVKVKQPTLSAA
jgi:topoisomerase-4 subunit A